MKSTKSSTISVILDTNVLVSAAIFGGTPFVCLEMARSGEFLFCTSPVLLNELARILRDKFDWLRERIIDFLEGLGEFAKVIEPTYRINLASDEPDNRVLEAAKTAEVDYIVTGDKKHLLSLKQFENTQILSPAEFVAKMSLKY